MFMPFELEPDDPDDGTPYDEVLTDYMQSKAHQFGSLFYRDRIAKHVAEGLELIAEGESGIERRSDLAKVVRWVKSYTKRLRAA
jgi:hypothetical protein